MNTGDDFRGPRDEELIRTTEQFGGELAVEQAFTRYVTRVAPYLGTEHRRPMVDDFSMEIGYRYDSPAIVLEPGSPPRHEHPRESAGRPGARAPHVFLERDGTRLSTLDLFGRNFVLPNGKRLFVGSPGGPDSPPAADEKTQK